MLNANTSLLDERSLDTVFAEDFSFKGKIVCKKSVMIKGSFQGQITVEEDLYLASSAQVEAEIEARNLINQGKHVGNAMIREGFTLSHSAQTLGDIKARTLEIEKGASFNGKFTMLEQKGAD